MAQGDLGVPIRIAAPKPRMTVYFALLIIALVAMLAGCIFLWIEIGRFGGFGSVPGTVSSLDRPAVLIAAGTEPQWVG
ncbi:MAG TPA: hypothetical protein VJ828_01595 [Lacipirellulaceae bacterium]|nr:hypothetical protein [Lacipirellulaceae bacterium]